MSNHWLPATEKDIDKIKNYNQNRLSNPINNNVVLSNLSYKLSCFIHEKNFRTFSWNSVSSDIPKTLYHFGEILERKLLPSSTNYKRKVNDGCFVMLWEEDYLSKQRFHTNGSLNKEWMAQHIISPCFSFEKDWDQQKKIIVMRVLYVTRHMWYTKKLGINWLQKFQS